MNAPPPVKRIREFKTIYKELLIFHLLANVIYFFSKIIFVKLCLIFCSNIAYDISFSIMPKSCLIYIIAII